MVSKDGKNFESKPIYSNTAANLQFVLSQRTKSIYVSKDGKNFESEPIYSNTALNFKIEFPVGTILKCSYIRKEYLQDNRQEPNTGINRSEDAVTMPLASRMIEQSSSMLKIAHMRPMRLMGISR